MRADAKSNRFGRRETRAVVEEARDGVDGEIRRGDDRSVRVVCERVSHEEFGYRRVVDDSSVLAVV